MPPARSAAADPRPGAESGAKAAAGGPTNARTMVFDGDAPPPPPVGPVQAKAVAAIQPGALLGRFEVTRRLGGGGMGEVFLARDPDLDRQVAIKVLSGPAAVDPDSRVRFLLEGRAAGRVSHPNIVTVHEVGPARLSDSVDVSRDALGDSADGAPRADGAPSGGPAPEPDGPVYLVMDYASDGSVEELLREGPLTVERATAVLADAAAGLAAAHAAGLVHRDVKPANLMLEGGGPWGGGCVKVMDFGLARRIDDQFDPGADSHPDVPAAAGESASVPAEASASSSVSTSAEEGGDAPRRSRRRVVGTPHFMSPEQCRGGAVDARGDIYSLGATYYALLAGRPPFAAKPGAPVRPVAAVLAAHKRSEPPPVHELEHLAAVPPACTRLIVRAMAKDPADRYPNAPALRADALALLNALRRHAGAPDGEGLRNFVLPSERPGDPAPETASGTAPGTAGETPAVGTHDPAADTPAAGTPIGSGDFAVVGDSGAWAPDPPPAGWGPPPGLRREVFSLGEGEVTFSYPTALKGAALSGEETDRLRAWLNLMRVKVLALAETRPPA